MIEVRFHGRGGQGAVIASKILAEAAFLEGKNVSGFPFFGVERRGAPVTAYTRIAEDVIRVKSGIYEPDYVIVMNSTLIQAVNVVDGLKPGGLVLVNTKRSPESLSQELEVASNVRVVTVDATGIAIDHRLGSKAAPIVNSSILGAFAKVSGLVKLASLVESIERNVPVKLEENAAAAKEAYDKVVVA